MKVHRGASSSNIGDPTSLLHSSGYGSFRIVSSVVFRQLYFASCNERVHPLVTKYIRQINTILLFTYIHLCIYIYIYTNVKVQLYIPRCFAMDKTNGIQLPCTVHRNMQTRSHREPSSSRRMLLRALPDENLREFRGRDRTRG